MNNKKELIVFGVCIVLVGLFIFVLPRLNDVVRDKNNLEEESYDVISDKRNTEIQFKFKLLEFFTNNGLITAKK